MEEKIVFTEEDVKTNKVFGILAYFGILFLVPLLAAKDSPYARFHANQGLVHFIFSVGGNIVVAILGVGLVFVPIAGAILSALLSLAVWAYTIVFLVIGIINACSGEPKKLPIIGGITILK